MLGDGVDTRVATTETLGRRSGILGVLGGAILLLELDELRFLGGRSKSGGHEVVGEEVGSTVEDLGT